MKFARRLSGRAIRFNCRRAAQAGGLTNSWPETPVAGSRTTTRQYSGAAAGAPSRTSQWVYSYRRILSAFPPVRALCVPYPMRCIAGFLPPASIRHLLAWRAHVPAHVQIMLDTLHDMLRFAPRAQPRLQRTSAYPICFLYMQALLCAQKSAFCRVMWRVHALHGISLSAAQSPYTTPQPLRFSLRKTKRRHDFDLAQTLSIDAVLLTRAGALLSPGRAQGDGRTGNMQRSITLGPSDHPWPIDACCTADPQQSLLAHIRSACLRYSRQARLYCFT